MFRNLRAEMTRKGINVTDLAKAVGMSTAAMYDRLNGKTGFTLDDAHKIRDVLDVDMTIDELFKKED